MIIEWKESANPSQNGWLAGYGRLEEGEWVEAVLKPIMLLDPVAKAYANELLKQALAEEQALTLWTPLKKGEGAAVFGCLWPLVTLHGRQSGTAAHRVVI